MAADPQRVEALAALERIGERLQHGAHELPSFDEEQLAACAPAARGCRLVPLPTVDGLDEFEYSAAIERGRTSLEERGYLDGEPAVPVDEFALVVAARAMPSLVAIVDRVVESSAPSSLYVFGLGSAGVLEERPEPNGDHHFTLRAVNDAAASVAAFVDPEGRAERDGSPHVLLGEASGEAEERAEVERRIAAAGVVARVFVTTTAPDGRTLDEDFSVVTADDGLLLVGGFQDPESGDRRAAAREVSAATLRDLLAQCLAGA